MATQHEYVEVPQTRKAKLREKDSMGRSPEQVEAMAQNEMRPLKLSAETREAHESAAEVLSEFPKCMYKVAISPKGIFEGDDPSPNYPMPFDAAADLGLDDVGFKVKGRKREDGGSVSVKLPYKTRSIGQVRAIIDTQNRVVGFAPLDIAACKAEEEALRKAGWVDSPNKLKYPPEYLWLVRRVLGQPEDAEPVNGNGHKG